MPFVMHLLHHNWLYFNWYPINVKRSYTSQNIILFQLLTSIFTSTCLEHMYMYERIIWLPALGILRIQDFNDRSIKIRQSKSKISILNYKIKVKNH